MASPGTYSGRGASGRAKSCAEKGSGTGDGQGQTHDREGYGQVEDPVHKVAHFSLRFRLGSGRSEAPCPSGQCLDTIYLITV